MGRQTWLADEFRKAGLKVVEVPGWKTRGSDSFSPVGVTWHATAGSRNSTAQTEVNVILNGSSSAPPPIAQIMIYRDGVVYVCAAGRCNHNKVGWAGPNKGLGNTALFGIEMANDNKGEPWAPGQLEAARRVTAVLMRKMGADPMRRLAAHYEHQPYEGRPSGETSTKSDPYGVSMSAERPRVRAAMAGGESVSEELDAKQAQQLRDAHYTTAVAIPNPVGEGRVPLHVYMAWNTATLKAIQAEVNDDEQEIKDAVRAELAAMEVKLNELAVDEAEIAQNILRGLGDTPVEDVAQLLRGVYDADELAALKAAL